MTRILLVDDHTLFINFNNSDAVILLVIVAPAFYKDYCRI